MSPAIENEKALAVRLRHGRAVNAVSDFLRNKLSVPNIYLEPRVALLSRVDVIAIDRAGSGDLHAVEIKLANTMAMRPILFSYIEKLKELPVHFKYLAVPPLPFLENLSTSPHLFAKNGIGRIGILGIEERGSEFPKITLISSAERFRVEGEDLTKIEKSLFKTRPDIEVRI